MIMSRGGPAGEVRYSRRSSWRKLVGDPGNAKKAGDGRPVKESPVFPGDTVTWREECKGDDVAEPRAGAEPDASENADGNG